MIHAAAAAKSLQSCPTLYNPIDGSPPGSAVPGILQARTLEWVAISFSSAWKGKVKVKSLSRFRLLATPWTAAHQAPPSMGFSRQEYWSGPYIIIATTVIVVIILVVRITVMDKSWVADKGEAVYLRYEQKMVAFSPNKKLIWKPLGLKIKGSRRAFRWKQRPNFLS